MTWLCLQGFRFIEVPNLETRQSYRVAGTPQRGSSPSSTCLSYGGNSMYAKIFKTLWTSSLAGKRDAQLVFIYLLAHCDPKGYVRMIPEGIAFFTGMPVPEVEAALAL